MQVIGGLVPGRGAVAAQAMFNVLGREMAVAMLADRASPRQIIDEIASEEFDPGAWYSWRTGARTRQYAVVALGFEPAAHTGSRAIGWAGDAQAPNVSVQGNMLHDAAVVRAAVASFRAEPPVCGPTLADRLMAALVAGSAQGGDRRCAPELSALSAFIQVARPHDSPASPYLDLLADERLVVDTSVWTFLRQMLRPEPGGPEDNPVSQLRERYAEWRLRQLGDRGCP